ncbi:ATP-dependent helicase, partial [bacterium]|nr:ATP-dependent helicase [bacterium]
MTDFTAKFNAELNRLNRQQRQAVDTLEGPVLVFAGPGTGKTQVLTLRIANLIHQGLAAPTEILALTFTNAAAANMKSRLVKLIGSSALQVNFSTFHGFCEQVIAANPEYFRFNSGSQPLSDLEQLLILEHLFDTLPLDTLRSPNKKYYAVPLCRQAINDLKRENVSPQVYDELLQKSTQSIQAEIDELSAKKRPPKGKIATLRKKLAKQQELSLVYHGYTQALAAQKRFDFADMILSVSEAFSQHPELLATYQEKYQYLLVDEYQDTNNYQDQILDALASYWGEQANIFVVGDPYQSIFRFQGANLENLLGFAERYPQAQVINLTTGYRCHNLTYQLAYRLTQTMTPLSERWQAQSGLQNFQNLTGKPAILTESVSRDNELINIFTRITGLIDAGVDPSQIAIIYHNNADAQQLMSFAQSYGLAFDVEGGINILESDLIQKLILLLQLVDKPENYAQVDPCCYHLLRWHALGFDELSVIKFIHAVNEKKLSLTQCLLDPGSPVWSQLRQDGVSDVNLRALQEFGQRVVSWSTEKNNLSVTNLLAKILDKGEILAWIRTQKDYLSLLLTLYSFQRAIASWQANQEHFDIAQLLDYLQALEEHHLSIPLKDLDVKQGAITLTTAHKAKGREWQHVFIYGLNKGVWDNVRQKPSIALPAGIIKHQILTEETDEEKRLLYVALTRASVQNYCSWHLREPTDSGDRQREPADIAHWLQEQESAGLVISQPELL